MRAKKTPSESGVSFTGGEMNDAHCAVRRVDALAPGASRSERVHAEILRIDVDVQLRTKKEKKRV